MTSPQNAERRAGEARRSKNGDFDFTASGPFVACRAASVKFDGARDAKA